MLPNKMHAVMEYYKSSDSVAIKDSYAVTKKV